MRIQEESDFLSLINQNLGIAHKVCRIYFREEEIYKDALQEMMYQLWRSFDSFQRDSKFSTWMYRVCLNTAITYKKKEQRHTRNDLEATHFQIADSDLGDKDLMINELYQAIGTLSALNKAIILLYLEEMSYEEIAGITGLSKSNISVKLVRIKRELESILKSIRHV